MNSTNTGWAGPGITRRVEGVRTLHARHRTVAPPIPRSAKIELTARCDFGCYFCASHTRPRNKADMTWDLYLRLARELRDSGVEQLGLFYIGESFLCDWLPDAIRYAKEVCGYPYVFLTTNGLRATPDRVRECMLSGLDSLKFAFNWANPAEFQGVTGIPASKYASVVRNLQAARSIRDDLRHETEVAARSMRRASAMTTSSAAACSPCSTRSKLFQFFFSSCLWKMGTPTGGVGGRRCRSRLCHADRSSPRRT